MMAHERTPLSDAQVRQSRHQTGRAVVVLCGLLTFAIGMANAMSAFDTVPATINGNAIEWPVITLAAVGWDAVAMVGLLVALWVVRPRRYRA